MLLFSLPGPWGRTAKLLKPSLCFREWAIATPDGPAPIIIASMLSCWVYMADGGIDLKLSLVVGRGFNLYHAHSCCKEVMAAREGNQNPPWVGLWIQ
jgi:hypothetical protein